MTTTGYLFFSFKLPGLCGSGAYVFSSGTRNSRGDLEEVASAWITEVYRGRANRGRHIPSEKLKVVCRNGWTPRSMSSTQTLRICVSSFIVITCEWTSLWKLLADCTSTMPDNCSADVFTGRHISSYNMVQFECLSTCVQCSHCSCITLWHVVMPPIARGQTWLCQPLPVSTVPNTRRNLSNSNCRGLDEEEERLIVQGYGNVTSMQFTGSYYRCYTVLRAPAILRHCFVDSLEIYTLILCLADLCTV